ncbi:hypothetical protein KIN20_006337 [Parelaphostrongylus tenuis]|uniref:Uncharacterized protein n=1 Tax=Parelaphostrongylus tenuis TaxID=148309 RepID=A0AAD5QGK6_PARTN|nr:hypothetical protein KIN20_006337 [Parelaphostrongylus tenuis]
MNAKETISISPGMIPEEEAGKTMRTTEGPEHFLHDEELDEILHSAWQLFGMYKRQTSSEYAERNIIGCQTSVEEPPINVEHIVPTGFREQDTCTRSQRAFPCVNPALNHLELPLSTLFSLFTGVNRSDPETLTKFLSQPSEELSTIGSSSIRYLQNCRFSVDLCGLLIRSIRAFLAQSDRELASGTDFRTGFILNFARIICFTHRVKYANGVPLETSH